MTKIYNEIAIDMNPESPAFEETIYEDSFDYEGDMMLAQREGWGDFNMPDLGINIAEGGDFGKTMGDYMTFVEPVNKPWEMTIEEHGWGAEDVTSKDMLGKTPHEMMQWIKQTKYGGKWPDELDPAKSPDKYRELQETVRDQMPKQEEIGGTDWYGLQDTASEVGAAGGNIYGGMGTSYRGQMRGQQQIGKDIYGLEEKKGKDWTSKFRSFLGSLPTAT